MRRHDLAVHHRFGRARGRVEDGDDGLVGRKAPGGILGNIATSLAASAPAPARYAGIAISTPPTSATSAAVRLGNDPFPALMSAIAAATASTSRSGSSAASTSRLLRTSMSGEGGIRTRERGKPPLRDFQSRSLSQLGHLSGAGAVCHRLCLHGHRDGRLAPARSTRNEVWGMPDERIDILRRVSLFDDLSDRELEAVANAAKERRFDTGDTVVGEGEGGVGFFVVADGTARVEVPASGAGRSAPGRRSARWRSSTRAAGARKRRRRVAASRVRHHGLAVHAAARAAPVDRRQDRQDPRPPPARGRGTLGAPLPDTITPTVLSGELAVPSSGNPL